MIYCKNCKKKLKGTGQFKTNTPLPEEILECPKCGKKEEEIEILDEISIIDDLIERIEELEKLISK